MKRKMTKAITAVMFAAVILFTAASCQLMAGVSPADGGIVIKKDDARSVIAEPTGEATGQSQNAAVEPTPSESVPAEVPTDVHVPTTTYINPLTGEKTSVDPSATRPTAVVVDNNVSALPHQTGLADADILFETLTAPGVTRFLALYSDFRTVPEICNVREARTQDARLAACFGALLISQGGHSDVIDEYDFYTVAEEMFGSENGFIDTTKEAAWSALLGETLGTVRYFSGNYRTDIKYDTVVTPEAISYTLNPENKSAFAMAGMTVNGEPSANFITPGVSFDGAASSGVTLSFTASGVNSSLKKNVTYKYSADSGSYLRFEESRPHSDSVTSKQLSFKNVVALFTDVRYIAGDNDIDPLTTDVTVYGSGTGYCFSGGKYKEIIWVNTAEDGLRFYTSSGALSLPEGNTYVGFLNKADSGALSIR